MTKTTRILWIGLILMMIGIAAPTGLRADVVVLKNGNRFEGQILEETPDKIVLKMQFGTMDFKRSQVQEVKKTQGPAMPPPAQEPKPDEGPQPPSRPEALPGARPTAGTLGNIKVVQKIAQTTKNYAMNFKSALALLYDDDPRKMIRLSFFPYDLTDEDIETLKSSMLRNKPSPDPKIWTSPPEMYMTIYFEEGKERKQENIAEISWCFFGFAYSNESWVEEWKGAKARGAMRRFNLSMDGEKGTLEIMTSGSVTGKREISQPVQFITYTWNINATCKALVR
ncbi:MAG: hypothetical protein AB1696_00435 [Planctomycetota bacterium]